MAALVKASSPASGHRTAARPTAARLASLALAALGLLQAASLGLSCNRHVPDEVCIGGVYVDGVCEGTCTPDKCLAQNTCVGNRCLLLCDAHADCLDDGSQSCEAATEDQTGTAIFVCQPHGKAAGLGASCLDGIACEASLECEASGDAELLPYCTQRDCQSDDECVAGFHCGVVRQPHDLCGPTCSGPEGDQKCAGGPRDGAPCSDDEACQKGNDSLCGETAEPCKTPGQDQTTLFEGSQCLLRKTCLKRGPGAACTTDLDCSRSENQRCATLKGEQRCAAGCSSDFECFSDAACNLEQGACLPKFGAWVGTGQLCEPCYSDEDCGSKGSTSACGEILNGGLACLDFGYPVQCTADADCPLAPSGLRGACQDEGENLGPGDPLYQRCSYPVNPATEKTSCW